MPDLDLDAIDPRKATPGQVADLVAALREARTEAKAAWEQAERDLAEANDLAAERDDCRRRYEAIRDGVLAWCDEPDWSDDPAVSPIALDRLRAVVARVERGES